MNNYQNNNNLNNYQYSTNHVNNNVEYINNQGVNSKLNNNNISANSRKILFVIVAVAALFVAVVSGTFAYFTASATNTTAINGTIAAAGISNLTVTKISSSTASNGSNLIPLDTDKQIDASSKGYGDMLNTAMIGSGGNSCVDSKGYMACQVYEVKVTMPANSPRLQVTGTLNITATTAPNISYALIRPQSTSAFAMSSLAFSNLTNQPDAVYYNGKATAGNNLTFSDIESTTNGYLAATTNETSYYYYFIVWLEDTNTVQNQGGTDPNYGSFTGQVTIGSTQGQITATFSS